jgi:hypothetical protein
MKLLRRTFRPLGTDEIDRELSELLRPGVWVVETGCTPPPAHCPGRLTEGFAVAYSMAISLRTATLLPLDLGPALAARLEAWGCVLAPLAGLALHEMLVNGAVHGNLQVGSGRASAWQELVAREQLIADALADPVRAGRMVTAALAWDARRVCAAIIDEGNGYQTAAADPPVADTAPRATLRAAGRGLLIARAVADVEVLRGGCCTRLTFARDGTEARA